MNRDRLIPEPAAQLQAISAGNFTACFRERVMNGSIRVGSERIGHDRTIERHEPEVCNMIAVLTRRFILISLAFVIFASAIAFAVGKQDRHSRSWVAGQSVPCVNAETSRCTPAGEE